MKRSLRILAVSISLVLIFLASPGWAQEKQEDVETLKQAVEKNPKDAKAYFKLGQAYEREGNAEKAMEAFKQAVKLKPDFTEARASLSNAYDKQGVAFAQQERWADAEKSLKEAIDSKPDESSPHFNLGVVYGQQRRWSDALGAFQETISLDPNNPNARYDLAVTYLMMDREAGNREAYKAYRTSALEQYGILVRLNPTLAGKLFYMISNPRATQYPTSPYWQAPMKSTAK